jgi:alpha-L-arabinofuranosidase
MIIFQRIKDKFSYPKTAKWDIQHFKTNNSLEILRYHNTLDLLTEKSDSTSENFNLYQVGKDGNYIQFIKNPSEDVQIAAVTQNRNAIRFIENPTDLVVFISNNKNASISSSDESE